MAGRNFSRYFLSLWSALFAPFNFLFTRLWRFFAQAIGKPARPSAPSSTSPTTSTTSTSTSSAGASDAAATTQKAESTRTAGTGLSASAPLVFPLTLHDQTSSHSIVGEDLPDHATSNGPGCENSEDNSTHLDHAVDPVSQDYSQRKSADMAKKRGGRGRGGAKSSIHQVAAVTPVTAVTPVSPAAAAAAANAVKSWPVSADQPGSRVSGDTSFTPNHANGPVLASFKQGGSKSRNSNPTVPPRQAVDSQKENLAPLKHHDTVSSAARQDCPALTPLAVTDNTRESQKSGARSDTAVDSASTAPAIKTMCNESPTSCDGAEQLHVFADRLTLDDAASSKQPVQQTLNDATSAAEASALPVPLVVAVPILPQLANAQPEPQTPPITGLPGLIEPTTEEGRAEREHHLKFMREALDMGDLALKTNETPVGCVLVYRGRTIARGMNATNVTRNGTRHAEFMALSALLSRRESGDVAMADINMDLDDASWGDVDPKDGHIYPYGQKLHPAPVVDRSIISECVLYVTVEPCVMCASLLRQLGIKKVYFGAVNDKFGGTGGVFRVHMNSKPVPIPTDRPYQLGYGPPDLSLISKGRAVVIPRGDDEGDGGNVESGYPVEGGYLRDDAVSLLRRFYVQENGRAPQPRKKEGRAARLYAAMENQNRPINSSDLSDNAPETPVEAEAPMALNGKPEPALSVVYA
ncbi:hypothetical protein F5Y01DRAFT_171466 [Xylaria sp. FL0043]|nr:hypothetical protein F5Y01DRAFT_171466 [Xylaria sp. FL0043]